MYYKVRAYIREHNMIKAGDLVLAGVSGGGDSMAMLNMLRRYQQELPFSLCAVHVHHGLRGEEADRDEALVRDTCSSWELPFLSYHYQVSELSKKWKLGIEETGRKVRQEAFTRAEKDFWKMVKNPEGDAKSSGNFRGYRIALAHNENDAAETMLHNLCRGTGLKGLAGILPVRDEIVRPVLCLNKKEIVNYLMEEHIPYITDSTNLTDEYTRNKIRHNILPLLEREINEASIRHMADAAQLAAQAEEYLSRQGVLQVQKYGQYRENGIFLSEEFWQEEPVIASYGLLWVFEQLAGKRKDFTAVHIKNTRELFFLQVGRRISLPYGLLALRTYGGIFLGKEAEESLEASEIQPLQVPGRNFFKGNTFIAKIILNHGQKIEEKAYTKWLDYDRIIKYPCIRTRKTGDYIVINSKGDRKKINRCMIDEKIPADRRDQVPLIAVEDEILWIIGSRISERYKITPCTRMVLALTYQGGNKNE